MEYGWELTELERRIFIGLFWAIVVVGIAAAVTG